MQLVEMSDKLPNSEFQGNISVHIKRLRLYHITEHLGCVTCNLRWNIHKHIQQYKKTETDDRHTETDCRNNKVTKSWNNKEW